ncbi:pre-mRNA splicing factor component-domain-containing protein [Gamsiella multidivaricata]|uniref:pre-mRNA splicing factor component-domain-containing protein n=1 Tax=Gamsiella multidivaricata TaxID=101098 RepID=UPI00221F2138|nr:pre-mRNA splicing factor component-domain-containing protein [Gamsiella multidivaricata]KAI7822394.1 pre-mRNA splicing factor component-domain-containing protein [Gamsiella multidivaricata]
MRIIIKGGVWKNTEDEILKAAVSKYGKNQWSRISSLLVRKTASQCKARWMEWLDPSIRKTEWSKEEDERLLHLAKLMPTQWRTIAPIVGRTASQCLERYQKLLDDAEQQAESELGLTGVQGGDSGPSADDVRRLRPGEIDPDPETKPARPDPVDMDEDEKEMLSEARARLANTQGKKAKRKARERQLEEARRLATLQKKRELKAAGIELKQRKKKKGMDYNADIPFEAKPAPGFYDTTEELKRESTKRLTNVRLEQLDGKRRADVEEEERKKDSKRAKLKKESGEAQTSQSQAQLRKLQAAEQDGILRRKKLVLPAPHVGEAELEEILKIGSVAEDAKALADESDIEATKNLIGAYKSTGTDLPTRTPRASVTQDSLMIEAMNQRAMLHQQTPLLGGETPQYSLKEGTGYDGITPRHSAIETPNPYLQTPRAGPGATPMRTPLRDQLSINRGAIDMVSTPREEKMRQSQLKNQLISGLKNLPTPSNKFTLIMPEELEAESAEKMIEEDAAEIAKRRKEALEAEEQARLRRRSQAVQRDLPRPTTFRPQPEENIAASSDSPLAVAERLIQEEMARLITYDAVAYPPVGSKVAGSTQNAVSLEDLSDDYLSLARTEVDQELSGPEAKERYEVFAAEFDQAWDEIQKEIKELQQIGLAHQFTDKRALMTKQATKASKLEKRMGVTLGGYQARSQALATQLLTAHEDLQSSELELASFKNLRIMEEAAVGTRLEALNQEVVHLSSRESFLQQKWDGLNRERQDILERIEKLHQVQQQRQQQGVQTDKEEKAPTSAETVNQDNDDEDIGPQPMQE